MNTCSSYPSSALRIWLFLFVVFLGGLRAAVPVLDPNFSVGLPAYSTVVTSALQPDGKILVGGPFIYTTNSGTGSGVARLNSNGSLDESFRASISGRVEYLILQEDGKIIAGSQKAVLSVGGGTATHLVRLNSDGSLDSTYAPVFGPANLNSTLLKALALQKDGKLVVGGSFATVNSAAKTRLARLNTDGTLDTGFSPDPNNTVDSLALKNDQLYVLGYFTQIAGISQSNLARLNQDGSCDTSFLPFVQSARGMRVMTDDSVQIFWNTYVALEDGYGGYTYQGPGMLATKISPSGSIVYSNTIVGGLWENRTGPMAFGAGFAADPIYSTEPNYAKAFAEGAQSYQLNDYVASGATMQENNGVLFHAYAYPNGINNISLIGRVLTTNFTPTLRIDSNDLITWSRSTIVGFPRGDYVKFQVSYDAGVSWSDLGYGTLTNIYGHQWQYSGSALPDSAILRTRSPVQGGYLGISQGFSGMQLKVGADVYISSGSETIPDGASSASLAYNTLFDPTFVSPANGYVTKTYTIRNTGAKDATVTSITVSGTHAADFTVGGLSLPTTVVTSTPKTFTLTFNPSAIGTRTATITVTNNDDTKGDYDFVVGGEGVEPEINLKGNDLDIVNGDTTPSVSDDTDYGPAVALLERVKTFTIENNGSGPLIISNIALSGVNAADFGVSQIAGPILPGESRTFNVTLYPSAPGPRSATITIHSNDSDEAAYEFAILGQGVEGWQLPSYAVNFSSVQSIPITTSSIVDLSGHELQISLSFAPPVGTSLKVIENKSLSFITGSYVGMAHGSQVILNYGNLSYIFIANYYGGDGNDLVLHWAGTLPYAWGENASGRLGDGTVVDKTSPVAVSSSGVLAGKTVLKVSAGGIHSLALCSDGTIAAWGENGSGQLGNNSTVDSNVPVLVNTASGVSALYGKTVVDVAAGYNFSLALCSDGDVVAWGDNASRQCGDAATTATDRLVPVFVSKASPSALNGKTVVRIATCSSAYHSLALCSDGTLVAWGRNSSKCLGNNSASTFHNVAVLVNTTTGALVGKQVIGMAAAADFSLALCSDDTIAAWGQNASGRLGNGTTTDAAIPTATSISPILVNSGSPNWTINKLITGAAHSLLIRSDGKAIAWGDNTSYGKLGINSTTDSLLPVLVNTDTALSSALYGKTVVDVSGGEQHSYALCSDGTMTSWGHNNVGQLGIGSTSPASRKVPGLVNGGSLTTDQRFVSISAGFDHAQALVASPQAVLVVKTSNNIKLTDGQFLDFGQMFCAVGTSFVENGLNQKWLYIQNQGAVTLTGITVTEMNDSSSSYQVGSFSPTSLAPGQSGSFSVSFNPTVIGTHTATVRISATILGATRSFDVNLTGSGSATEINANYLSGSETPVIATTLDANGKTVNFNFGVSEAPSLINVVRISDSGNFIQGFFSNLPDNEVISLTIGGQVYSYLVNYYSNGNDLVLERIDFAPLADPDTDGLTNLQEFLTGTNQADHKSFTRPINWISTVNTTGDDSNGALVKTSGTTGAWDADAISQVKLIGNGSVSFSVRPGSELSVGLGATNSDQNYTSLTHAIKFSATEAAIYQSGVLKANLGGYGPNTTFTIRRNGQSISYLKNRTQIYSSTFTGTGPLIVDTSLASASAEIIRSCIQTNDLDADGMDDAWEFNFLGTTARWAEILAFTGEADLDGDGLTNQKEFYFNYDVADPWSFMRPVIWEDHRFTENISGNQGGLTKNERPFSVTEDDWDADAVSWQITKANSVVHFRLAENAATALGLSVNNATASNTALNYAIVATSENTAAVYESGVFKFNLGAYDNSTWFSIRRGASGQIQYQKNRQTLYSTTSLTTAEMKIDTSFFTLDGSVLEAFVDLPGDQDQDGLPDSWEKHYVTGWDGLLAFLPEGDDDDDSLSNLAEYQAGTEPLDSDSDHDNLPDNWEILYGFDPLDADEDDNGVIDGNDDLDHDGLANAGEVAAGTDPRNYDTDGDGLSDGWEVGYGVDPLDPDQNNNGTIDSDDNFDTDQLLNFQEFLGGTSPWLNDTDEDGVLDDEEFYPDFTSDMDADGDGVSDEDEVAAGSDPQDRYSNPWIQFQVTTPLR